MLKSPKYFLLRWIFAVALCIGMLYALLMGNESSSSNRHLFYGKESSDWDKYAIAVKSGKDIAQERVPIQLLTFLAPVRNLLLIGETGDVNVGDIPMVDVVTNLYSKYDKRDHQHGSKGKEKFTTKNHSIPITDSPLFFQKRNVDEIVPNEQSLGWQSDAHKNIPGFRVLYERYPNADWYMMIDDDTYVFLKNLHDLLQKFDANKPYYIGTPNMFTGCDGITKWGSGPFFAQGGSGIVVSRAALLKMLPIIDTCISKYRDCWAGDVRLALCLRDAGVLVGDPGGFFSNPPNDRSMFNNTCMRPITFHHLLVHQIQNLHEFEKKSKSNSNRFVTMTDIVHHFIDEGPVNDSNRVGADYSEFPTKSLESCKKACEDQKQCRGYTLQYEICYLKDAIMPMKPEKGAITGIVKKHFDCGT